MVSLVFAPTRMRFDLPFWMKYVFYVTSVLLFFNLFIYIFKLKNQNFLYGMVNRRVFSCNIRHSWC